MRNNKGYTLTELLLAMVILVFVMMEIVNLMRNTSLFYNRGRDEIVLQTEAQQLIQQFEELAIDCDQSIDYAGNVITVSNKSGTVYRFELKPNATKPYGNVYLSVSGGPEQLMAEYVKSFSIDKTTSDFDHTSKVIFKVEMLNDRYEYVADKDIYLRNDIGGSMIENSSVDESVYDASLEILRYKTYDLNEVLPEFGGSCTFSWDTSEVGHNGSAWYTLDTAAGTIKCSGTLNQQIPGTMSNEYVLKTNTGKKIRVYTLDLSFGYDFREHGAYGRYGVHYMMYNAEKDNLLYSYITASGISLADCKEFTVTPMYRFGGTTITKDGKSYDYFMAKTGSDGKFIINNLDADLATSTYFTGLADNQKKERIFYKGSFCGQIAAPEGSGSIDDAYKAANPGYTDLVVGKAKRQVNIPTMYLNIFMGYANDDGTFSEAGLDKDNKEFEFRLDGEATFEIRSDINSIKCGGPHFYASGAWKPSLFYENGGEIFYDVRLVFDDDRYMDCKVVVKPVGKESPGEWDFQLSDLAMTHLYQAGDTGMACMELKDLEGNAGFSEVVGDYGSEEFSPTAGTPTPGEGGEGGEGGTPGEGGEGGGTPAPGEGGEGGGTPAPGEGGGTPTGGETPTGGDTPTGGGTPTEGGETSTPSIE